MWKKPLADTYCRTRKSHAYILSYSITWPSVSGTLKGSDMGDSFDESVTVTRAVTFFKAVSLKVVAS